MTRAYTRAQPSCRRCVYIVNLIPQLRYLRYLEQHQNVICYYKMAWEKVNVFCSLALEEVIQTIYKHASTLARASHYRVHNLHTYILRMPCKYDSEHIHSPFLSNQYRIYSTCTPNFTHRHSRTC